MPTRFNVRRLREALGMTQRELAEAVPVHERTVIRWEQDGPTGVSPSPLAVRRLEAIRDEAEAAGAARGEAAEGSGEGEPAEAAEALAEGQQEGLRLERGQAPAGPRPRRRQPAAAAAPRPQFPGLA